ncbi:MAG: GNAT family N-acetyltransferase [Verrucomicrobia bacterium]|nr:GNAT family N-acetyltransferase [Verrucomicrobiota bacterium]MBV9656817.1 GNAT family N-acetyltransferase [Verrucomicrobiota bacterium]
MSASLTLRPICPEDEPFLCALYASTRADELAATGWSAEQRADFLRRQFHAQHAYYQTHFPAADFFVIQADGQPVGRLYVDRSVAEEIHLIDIALLPAQRRAGIGSALVMQLLAEGEKTGRPVRGYVEWANPALGFYQRLGFRATQEVGLHHRIEWTPPDAPAAAEDDGFERFRRLVLRDPELQATLQQATDREEFTALTLRLGEQHDCRFAAGDVDAAWQAAQRAWIERWLP